MTDDAGTRIGVLIGIDDCHRILKDEEELESIRAYDAAKATGDEAIPFEQAVKEIENSIMTKCSFCDIELVEER